MVPLPKWLSGDKRPSVPTNHNQICSTSPLKRLLLLFIFPLPSCSGSDPDDTDPSWLQGYGNKHAARPMEQHQDCAPQHWDKWHIVDRPGPWGGHRTAAPQRTATRTVAALRLFLKPFDGSASHRPLRDA